MSRYDIRRKEEFMGIEDRKSRLRLLAYALCGCFALAGCGGNAELPEAPELIEPADSLQENIYAERRDIYTLKTLESVVLPRQEELSFSCSGIIESVDVYIGKRVEEGQVLAAVHDTAGESCQILYEQLEAMRAESEYNNRRAEIEIEIARLSGQDTARLELLLAQSKEMQEFEEQHLMEQIEREEKEKGNNEIIAPFSGTVTAIAKIDLEWDSVEAGRGVAVAQGDPVIVLAAEDERYLKTVYVDQKTIDACETYYALIDGKQYALEYIPYSDEELEAMTAGNQTILSSFRLLDAQDVAFGANAYVCLVSDYRENVLAVPKSALHKEWRDYYVYVLENEIRVKMPVEVGVIGEMYAEITEGLEEGACISVED